MTLSSTLICCVEKCCSEEAKQDPDQLLKRHPENEEACCVVLHQGFQTMDPSADMSAPEPGAMRLVDYPRIPGSVILASDSARMKHVQPEYNYSNLRLRVSEPWLLIGWCGKMPDVFMKNRDGQIGLLFWHPEWEQVWVHFPGFGENLSLITVSR